MQGVYRIRNKLDDMRYIGSTNDFGNGWISRQQALRRGVYHNIRLQRAWNKYGEENFVFEVEEEVKGDRKALLAVEQVYLDEGFRLGILYNTAKIAGHSSFAGKHHTEEAKQKNRIAHLGKRVTQKTRDLISRINKESGKLPPSHKGIPHTKKHCANISKALMGHDVTEETRTKISKANEGNEKRAKPYHAFYNEKTKEFIPTGTNLTKICQERNLSYGNMWNVERLPNRITKDGWRLATEQEIERFGG